MRQDEPSQTAAWVAAARALGQQLPDQLVLARDPYGLRFASRQVLWLATAWRAAHGLSPGWLMKLGPLSELILWMQLRTRFIDDRMLDFIAEGGKQIVLLGAGYDCRSLRFRERLFGVTFYEVDHPATQDRKLSRLRQDEKEASRYVPWDFEHNDLTKLPATLVDRGLRLDAPTLTIWEGVTMYLSEQAIAESVRCVHALGSEGSELVFNYIDKRELEKPRSGLKSIKRIVKRAGEPYQFGFDPQQLPRWLSERGFSLVRDVSDRQIANEYWPLNAHHLRARDGRRIAVARSAY